MPMNKPGRYELWRRKLSYLVGHHGGLAAIARATGLKTRTLQLIVNGIPQAGSKQPPHLDAVATRQIERSLDLPEGWFDAPVFLPSRLEG